MVNPFIGGHNNNDAGDPDNWAIGVVPDAQQQQSGFFDSNSGVAVVHGNELLGADLVFTNGGGRPPTVVLTDHANLKVKGDGPATIVVQGSDTLELDRGIGTDPKSGTTNFVTIGTVHDHLALSGIINFGTYTQYGAELDTGGVTFIQASVLLDCDISVTKTNNQLGTFSGARTEINGSVDKGVQIIVAGTGQVRDPSLNVTTDPGFEGQLVIDNSKALKGFVSLDDGFVELRDLHNITSYKIRSIAQQGFQTPNVAVDLYVGNRVADTVRLYEAGGVGTGTGQHNVQVAIGSGSSLSEGAFIYDASDTQIQRFGLTKLPQHS
jgi:hypothetical protein